MFSGLVIINFGKINIKVAERKIFLFIASVRVVINSSNSVVKLSASVSGGR